MPALSFSEGFEWVGWRFEVVDMDGRCLDKVVAMLLHPSQSAWQQR